MTKQKAPGAYIVANPHEHPADVRVIALGDGEDLREFFTGDAFDGALVSADVLAEFLDEGVIEEVPGG
jgi:hypothetical protein